MDRAGWYENYGNGKEECHGEEKKENEGGGGRCEREGRTEGLGHVRGKH